MNNNTINYTDIFKLKRKLCTKLRKTLRPLLWKCGYEDTKIFAFSTAGLHNYKISSAINRELQEFQGFYYNGIIDAHGGGMMLYPFAKFPIEDLIRVDKFLNRHIVQFKKHREKLQLRE